MSDHTTFKHFAKSIEVSLRKYEPEEGRALLETQREQIRTLIALENKLRRLLIKHPFGASVYKKFIMYITEDKRNILAARPYFRERQKTFTKSISGAFKNKKHKTLYRFRINYSFILFVLRCYKWPKGSKIKILATEIEQLRNQIA